MDIFMDKFTDVKNTEMLKRKLVKNLSIKNGYASNILQKQMKSDTVVDDNIATECSAVPALIATKQQLSEHFSAPLWKRFYDTECDLNIQLQKLCAPKELTHVYNPVEYAADVHCAYLRRFLANGTKRLVFVGMNPGANGMAQTGVPFGNISTVRDRMQLAGVVRQPKRQHAKRPIKGFACCIEEPSGVRIWTLLARLAGDSLETFAKQCFVHNFCPLAFFDSLGRNITPSELKGDYKLAIRDCCLATLEAQLELLQAEIVVGVGEYVYSCLNHSPYCRKLKLLKMPHPSPRALNNHNWPEKAEKMLTQNDLLQYLRNE